MNVKGMSQNLRPNHRWKFISTIFQNLLYCLQHKKPIERSQTRQSVSNLFIAMRRILAEIKTLGIKSTLCFPYFAHGDVKEEKNWNVFKLKWEIG